MGPHLRTYIENTCGRGLEARAPYAMRPLSRASQNLYGNARREKFRVCDHQGVTIWGMFFFACFNNPKIVE